MQPCRKEERILTHCCSCCPPANSCSFASIVCFCYRYRKSRERSPEELEEITTAESLQFDFRTVRAATDDFSVSNKLGEGGFGGVYKGMLPNGQEIAVKRLSTNSGQGSREFKTEVLLVARLQHKNLVRLLGFCLRKDEKLLVYELLPNSSLDKVLLDRRKDASVDWETRYKIIAGIARGLLYLHEDSRLKIIHRDLKSSNILLDESMNPKISDFGLAKLVGKDQIQADTNRIVGTYGYMAPEYAMTGRFSVKSDVYSFGVIVLEIISGHKCNSTAFPYQEESLIQRAQRLWNDDKALEMVDPRLGGNFSSNELSKCIHIGLLCIQEDANRRPTMVPIVSALNGHPVDLPAPSPPQLASNGHVSPQASSTFSGNKDSITQLYPRLAEHVRSMPGTLQMHDCQNDAGKYIGNSTYKQNLKLALSDLISHSTTWFYNSTAGEGLDKVYALFYCRGDIGSDNCHDCVQDAALNVHEWCPSEKEAIIWYEQCTLWYANRLIFSREEEDPWVAAYNPVNVTNPTLLEQVVFGTVGSLINEAAYNATLKGFSTGIARFASSNVYCIVQCTPNILGNPCYKCLTEAVKKVRAGGPKAAFIFLPTCRLMYDFDPLFFIRNGDSYILFKVALPIAIPVFFLSGMSIGCCLKTNKQKRRS
ncbi:LOW QUALITY PROTEIN: hypothetical protein Cgig2_011184 [Carnegiea gigantea]|uniref:Cysteine-rich receptor-like protein kinase 25 n=1 Tax=Carnegiea gigantea TaxID=171969 RepID=A0A9Q1QI21_9CARY|nr:LOW QUALITY PROTEIN: hypothetical protein Cgig2_011184 [Carnegiea gigantea]